MKKLNIAILAGGNSSEREVSLGSAAQVGGSLDSTKYNLYPVDVHFNEWAYADEAGNRWQVDKNDFSVTVAGEKVLFDYALILIHGTPGEDGRMQGYLDMLGVSYSSCDMVSSVITFDKQACKRAVSGAGINLAREVFIRKGDAVDAQDIVERLGLPLFVKPNASGSSFGVTKIKSPEGIVPAVEEALKESEAVLIEEFVGGREMACGMLVTKEKEYVFPVTEVVSKKEFFDYQAKYTPGFSEEITPADIDEKTLAELKGMTLRAYKACGCRGIVRVDFIVKPDGTPVMIEINSVPGMSKGSIVPQQAAYLGMTLGDLYDIVIADTYRPRG